MSSGISLIGRLRAIRRMIVFICALAWYLSGLMLKSWIFGETEERGFRYRRKFTGVAMRIFGVRHTVSGQASLQPALYVSNHRSLLDPIIQFHYIDAYVVAKAEISKYPLIGRGAHETGVIFVKREDKDSRTATRDTIRETLQSGKSVFIYPEGTTSNAMTTQPFKLGSFEIAAELKIPVVPVMIDYANHDHYWHNMGMLAFFMRKFASRKIVARVSIGEPIRGGSALELMERSREWIGREIVRERESENVRM